MIVQPVSSAGRAVQRATSLPLGSNKPIDAAFSFADGSASAMAMTRRFLSPGLLATYPMARIANSLNRRACDIISFGVTIDLRPASELALLSAIRGRA